MDIPFWILWLALTIILVIIELLSTIAITLCLATGTFASFIAALCGASFEWQLGVLAIATVATLPLFPRLIKRYRLHLADGNESSNMQALIGRRAVVWKSQDDAVKARIKLDGDNWQAVSIDGSRLEAGQQVEVVGYDSIIIKVKPCNQ